jgi:Bacterial Ig-like domain
MKNLQLVLIGFIGVISLVSCPPTGTTTPEKPVVDTTPPTIVSVSPADGAIGVAKDTDIVIKFSEPMNKIATKAAYESATSRILPIQVSINLSADGTEMTINPNADLFMAAGADPATVVAIPYAFQITNIGTDLAGNALTTSSFGFKTRRVITQNLPGLASLSGDVRADGALGNNCTLGNGDICAGDSSSAGNAQYKGFASFDMTGVPTGVLSFDFATLSLNQIQTAKDDTYGANPYPDLGGTLNLEHVNFATKDLSAFSAAAIRSLGAISSDATLELKSANVLVAFQEDYAQRATRGDRSQYRVAFPNPSDFDGGKFDVVIFAKPTAAANPSTLNVRYYIP